MSDGSLVPLASAAGSRAGSRWPLPSGLQKVLREVDERSARLPTRLNEYGYDPFGFQPGAVKNLLVPMVFAYRHYFRAEVRGIENVPEGRVLVIGNHAGNTFAWDGAMIAMSLFLEGEPPRLVRGMAEYYLPTIPFFNVFMHRMGSVVGRPETCKQLLENEEAVMVFPEGERGFVKTYAHAYELQRFGLGFMRLALETGTPIVPVGIVGAEEQSPGIANPRRLGKLIGAPAFPITATFPLFGLAGFIPLPVKFRLHYGEPLRFEGDAGEDDARIEKKVEVVKDAIRGLIQQGLSERTSWFT
jgi:1-acyl-sn-glycerol-3-phosphate acyltransferase